MPSPLILRLTDELGYPLLDAQTLDPFLLRHETVVLFFTEDPARFPESNDLAVVLPELMAHFNGAITPAVVCQKDQRALQGRFGFSTWPTLVFLRKGRYLGAISQIQNWGDYISQIEALQSAEPVPPPGVGIAVLSQPI